MGKMMNLKKHFRSVVPLLLLQHFFYAGIAQKITFVTKAPGRVAVGARYQYKFVAYDSLKQAINYTCAQLPPWLQLDKKTNTLSGIAKKAGQYPVQLNAVTKDTLIKQQFMLTVYDQQTINILPLGNSLTNGTNVYNSYRRYLWQLLHKANYNVDFIGSWDKHHMDGNMPNADFDMDHEGHSGWKASDVLKPPDWDKQRGNIDDWLQSYRPDIVLIELGTNEVFQCVSASSAMNDFLIILNKLRKKNSLVKILLAQIPPLGKEWAPKKLCGTDTNYEQAVILFNNAILHFGHTKTTSLSTVIIVDQFTGVDPAIDMYDDIHPNATGEKKMAERWYEALKPFLKKLK